PDALSGTLFCKTGACSGRPRLEVRSMVHGAFRTRALLDGRSVRVAIRTSSAAGLQFQSARSGASHQPRSGAMSGGDPPKRVDHGGLVGAADEYSGGDARALGSSGESCFLVRIPFEIDGADRPAN